MLSIGSIIAVASDAGPAAFFALNAAVVASGVLPTAPTAIAAGSLYGAIVGTALFAFSATLGSMLLFFLCRSVLRGFILSRMQAYEAKIAALNRACQNDGFQIVGLLRLSPVMPFGLTTALLAFTDVGHGTHALATLAGLIPSSFVYVYGGMVAKDIAAGTEQTEFDKFVQYAGMGIAVLATAKVVQVAQAALDGAVDEPKPGAE